MLTVSPPVSPKVVAAILTIQKVSVTAGTLLAPVFLSGMASNISAPREAIHQIEIGSRGARLVVAGQ